MSPTRTDPTAPSATPAGTATPGPLTEITPAATKSPRHRSRELALQGLYQWRIGGADGAAVEAHCHEDPDFDQADLAFFRNLLRGTLAQADTLREQLQPCLDRPYNELSPVESCVLLLATFELNQHPETPYRVIINEAIELTKTFGGTDGHRFVNGVLDKLAAQLRPTEFQARRKPRNNAPRGQRKPGKPAAAPAPDSTPDQGGSE